MVTRGSGYEISYCALQIYKSKETIKWENELKSERKGYLWEMEYDTLLLNKHVEIFTCRYSTVHDNLQQAV